MRRLAGGGAPILQKPKLVQAPNTQPAPIVAPTALVPLTDALNVGAAFGAVGPISGPPGEGGGSGGGPGGAGSGEGGGNCVANCGGGVGVTEPVAIYSPDPEYSDAARKAKFQGTVIVGVIIDVDGHVYDPRIIQPLGLGLDQKALDAVLHWRFKPAQKDGHPVRVAANIEVNFRLF